eukprot:SAG22_NODE_2244_length_2796_cov_2.378198_4_plen_211_part_00
MQVRQRSSPLKAVITAFPCVSLPFLAVQLLSHRTVAISDRQLVYGPRAVESVFAFSGIAGGTVDKVSLLLSRRTAMLKPACLPRSQRAPTKACGLALLTSGRCGGPTAGQDTDLDGDGDADAVDRFSLAEFLGVDKPPIRLTVRSVALQGKALPFCRAPALQGKALPFCGAPALQGKALPFCRAPALQGKALVFCGAPALQGTVFLPCFR